MSETKRYLAVAVDADEVTVWDDHFGEAPRFHLYDPHGQFVEARDNPYWQEGHDSHAGPKRIVELLPECGVFIGREMGNGQKILPTKFGVQPFITTKTTVREALDHYLSTSKTIE